ncbi:hypothetical protein CCR75_005779 [Bremia lactucae]|uniref:Uncharacterized protein n=1 Tax=Bremia lactucae TaxID=4779 RepID=A0A976FGQ4_BRELC|nr:hypothetical protein CCR75_005779 [Bremia lactucae]
MVLRHSLLSLSLLLLPIILGQQCAYFSKEDLFSRLEMHIKTCIDPIPSTPALSTLTERFIANEFDGRQPLALVFFSNSSHMLRSLAGALASSLFGSSRSPQTVQSVDFQALLEPSPRLSNYDIKQRLRAAIAAPLNACPERSLFVLENVQALDDVTLPVLDVFLDPLNGKRAQFQHHREGLASRVFDCTNSVFLFLFKVTASNLYHGDEIDNFNWREYLVQRWTRSQGSIEEFTPHAFVGRLTDAVAVFPKNGNESAKNNFTEVNQTREWRQMCELQLENAESDQQQENGHETSMTAALSLVSENFGAAAHYIPGAIAMMSIPAYLLILTRAKRWNGEIIKKRGSIHRRRHCGGSGSTKRKRRKARK